MSIQDIKQAIISGSIICYQNSLNHVRVDESELWGLCVYDTTIHMSRELTRSMCDDCYILDDV
jgi:hypothetical protein